MLGVDLVGPDRSGLLRLQARRSKRLPTDPEGSSG
jgi:hypothetical protein